jgi:hypothetical protein
MDIGYYERQMPKARRLILKRIYLLQAYTETKEFTKAAKAMDSDELAMKNAQRHRQLSCHGRRRTG